MKPMSRPLPKTVTALRRAKRRLDSKRTEVILSLNHIEARQAELAAHITEAERKAARRKCIREQIDLLRQEHRTLLGRQPEIDRRRQGRRQGRRREDFCVFTDVGGGVQEGRWPETRREP